MKSVLKEITPPIIIKIVRKIGWGHSSKKIIIYKREENEKQNLDMYFDPEYIKVLDTWGLDSTWIEIQLLLCNCSGKVLDIACGSGVTIDILKKYSNIEVYGCDISDLLIKKALERDISSQKLLVTDATKMSYSDHSFDYSYSIGSLEHFTEKGIEKFISEASRVTRISSMHMLPTSKSGDNEGWMNTSTTVQTFYNNSDNWWVQKFLHCFREVKIINSRWNDDISFGRWFICNK